MIVYGYAKGTKYANDGTLLVQVRIPLIHGSYKQVVSSKTYTRDADLPWYPSLLLPYLPNEGEVVALLAEQETKSPEYIVIGLTGGSYASGLVIDE